MVGFRGAGVLGATVIIAGGVAYLVWRHTGKKKPKSRPETETETQSGARRDGEEAEERREERPAGRLSASPAPPVIEVTPAPQASQVQNFHTPSSTGESRRRMLRRKYSELTRTRPSFMFDYSWLSLYLPHLQSAYISKLFVIDLKREFYICINSLLECIPIWPLF